MSSRVIPYSIWIALGIFICNDALRWGHAFAVGFRWPDIGIQEPLTIYAIQIVLAVVAICISAGFSIWTILRGIVNSNLQQIFSGTIIVCGLTIWALISPSSHYLTEQGQKLLERNTGIGNIARSMWQLEQQEGNGDIIAEQLPSLLRRMYPLSAYRNSDIRAVFLNLQYFPHEGSAGYRLQVEDTEWKLTYFFADDMVRREIGGGSVADLAKGTEVER